MSLKETIETEYKKALKSKLDKTELSDIKKRAQIQQETRKIEEKSKKY